MLEKEFLSMKLNELSAVQIVDGSKPDDFRDFELRGGHSKKYRGNHRSHVRGKGFFARFRSAGMKHFR